MDRVRPIIDEHFLTRATERRQRTLRNRSREGKEGEDYRISIEDLVNACKKITPNKEVGVDGIPRTVVKALVERRAEKWLRVLNTVNNTGKIPARWKIASVVLIPKPGRDPTLTSSFRPISVLPALGKV